MLRSISKEELVFKSNEMRLDLKNDLKVNVKIDGKDESFLFDTGASNIIVLDTTLIKDYSKKERFTLFKTKDPNGNLSTFYTPADIETNMFSYNNCLVTVLPAVKSYCSNNYYYCKGIIGSSFFKQSIVKKYLFDFDNLILKITTDKLTDKDYLEVKSKFFNNHFAIYLNINGYEEPFMFDTGNTVYPLIIGSNSNIKPTNYIDFEGSDVIVGSGNLKTNSRYSNENDLFISKHKINTPICFTSAVMKKYNNMGLNFIMYFNWIVDFENKKVFFKRNNLILQKQDIIPKYKYLCMIINKKIKVIAKLKSELIYNVGDEITAVNNQKVRPSNICEMQDLLNKTQDWNALKLEIVAPPK